MEPREEPRKSSTYDLIDHFWQDPLVESVSSKLEKQILLSGKEMTPGFRNSVLGMIRSTSREARKYHQKSPNDSLTLQFHLARLTKRMRGYLINVRHIQESEVPETFDLRHEAAPAEPAVEQPPAVAAAVEPAVVAEARETAVLSERVRLNVKALNALRTALSKSRKGLVAAYQRGVTPAGRFVWRRRKVMIPATLGVVSVAAFAYQAIARSNAEGTAGKRERPKVGDISKPFKSEEQPKARVATRKPLERDKQLEPPSEPLAEKQFEHLSKRPRSALPLKPEEQLRLAHECYRRGLHETDTTKKRAYFENAYGLYADLNMRTDAESVIGEASVWRSKAKNALVGLE